MLKNERREITPRCGMKHTRNGWPLLCGLAAAQIAAWGSVYYSFSLFVVPMEAELGWSRTDINGALSFGLLVSGFAAYPVGAWIDRHGGRAVMTVGSLLATVLLAAWSQIANLLLLYAIWFGLGVALAATLYEPVFAVITRTFPESYKSRITVLTLIAGFASTVFIPLTQLFISALGWRNALLALAVCNAVICLPVHAFLLKDGSVHAGIPGSGGDREADDTLRRALRHPVFWGLLACYTAYYAAFSAMTFHIIPLLTDRAVPTATIIAAVAVIGPAQVAGRLILFAGQGKFSSVVAGRFATAVFPASVLLLIFFPVSVPALFAFAACYGAANGIMTIVRGTAVPDLLWREGYGAINGALTFPSNIAKAVAPFGAAVIWKAAGNYDAVLWSVLATGSAAALAFWRASAQRPKVRL